MSGKRIALVAADSHGGERWGETRLLEGLASALQMSGLAVEIIRVVHDESSYEAISSTYDRYAVLDLSSFDAVVSTNIPGCLAPHPRRIAYLTRTARRFYDMFDTEYPSPSPELRQLRRHVQELDRGALQSVGSLFVIGNEIRGRLLKYLGVDSEVLYPSTSLPLEESASYEFLLLPGRLHPWKRADLIVRAMPYVQSPVELLICGEGESEVSLREIASGDPRIRFLGRIDDEKLARFYSRALAVPFVPIGEDFGSVALEAALSGKPVITCVDSGEPARMIFDGRTGFVCSPDPKEIGRCIEIFAQNPELASAMGRIGRGSMSRISWDHIASVLCSSLGIAQSHPRTSSISFLGGGRRSATPRTLVLDTHSVHPVIEGSRSRVLGLYGGTGFPVEYLGACDRSEGESERLVLASTLTVRNIPLSEAHIAERESLRTQPGGSAAIEVSFPLLGHLTPEYATSADEMIRSVDTVVFSRPWSYPLVAKSLAGNSSLVVYDAHGVESVQRCALLDDGASGTELVGFIGELESGLSERADLIIVPCHKDRLSLARLYDMPCEKIRVVPNAAFTENISPPSEERKIRLKEAEGLTDALTEIPVALFMGSASSANVEAAEFILRKVAPALPNVSFLLFGSASDAVACPTPRNARLLGIVDEERKRDLLSIADVALDPILSDSGGNHKMFDFMAAGLPVLATPPAARGIDLGETEVVVFSSRDRFVEDLSELLEDRTELARCGAAGRCIVEERHSWEKISRDLGALISWHSGHRSKRKPFFSIIVPAHERPKSLERLARLLSVQTFADFELVVVDQSSTAWEGTSSLGGIDLLYHRIDARGAVHARNTGAFLARGSVLAFLDDDCEPSSNWLAAARPWFDDPKNVALEGAIRSDLGWNDDRRRNGDERKVSKTANFFIRTEIFNRADGFDDPRFGEEGESGLRLKEYGATPFCENAWVFRPPR